MTITVARTITVGAQIIEHSAHMDTEDDFLGSNPDGGTSVISYEDVEIIAKRLFDSLPKHKSP